MEELNKLAARVWERVAAGEAYRQPTRPKAKPKQQQNSFLPLLVLLLMTMGKQMNDG